MLISNRKIEILKYYIDILSDKLQDNFVAKRYMCNKILKFPVITKHVHIFVYKGNNVLNKTLQIQRRTTIDNIFEIKKNNFSAIFFPSVFEIQTFKPVEIYFIPHSFKTSIKKLIKAHEC